MRTMAQIKSDHIAIGGHWFDKESMRFFNSRVYGPFAQTPEGDLFVSSERCEGGWTEYTVRIALPSGEINNASEFRRYETLADARSAIARGEYGWSVDSVMHKQ